MRVLLLILLAAFAHSASGGEARPGRAGKPAGRYDPAQARGCEKSCALAVPYKESELAPQPGAPIGRLTRCPVSGVVFRAGENGPAAGHRGKTYRFCCKSCEKKFRRSPARFVG